MTSREWDRAYAEASGDWSGYIKKWKDEPMTDRMAIVPVEATEEATAAAHGAMFDEPYSGRTAAMVGAGIDAAIAASPNAGKVSNEQLTQAMIAIGKSKPYMPHGERLELVRAVAGAWGLEIE